MSTIAHRTVLKYFGLAWIFALGLLVATPAAQAQDWDAGGDGFSWGDPLNWSTNLEPTLLTLARLNLAGGSNVSITLAGEVADRFIIGQGATGIQKLTIDSGSLTTDSTTVHRIGQTSEGWLTMNAGTLTTGAGVTLNSGGRLIVNGGDINIGSPSGSIVGDSGGAGFLEINGSSASFDVGGALTFTDTGTAIFTADSGAIGVTSVNNTGLLTLSAASTLTVDLTSYDFGSFGGSDIVLFDYGTLSGTFGTVNIVGGDGTLSYAFDQGGGDLSIALLDVHVVPEPSSFLLMLAGMTGLWWCRPCRLSQNRSGALDTLAPATPRPSRR